MAVIDTMIPGMGKFEEWFADDAGLYVVIGGAARELVYAEAGQWEDTATKDLDVVLIAETLNREFAAKFLRFVGDAGYSHVTKSGDSQLYRFSKPDDPSFPHQIELLSRRPDYMDGAETVVGRIPIDDSEYSLSAILLDDNYYVLLASGEAVTDKYGIPTLKHEYLPVFKMRAYDDLAARAAAGEAVRSSEVGKHRRDVFRLVSLLPGDARVGLPDSIRDEVERFLATVTIPSPDYLKSIGLGRTTLEQVKAAIRSTYLSG